MKKILLMCILSFILFGCGGNPGMSDKDYETGKEILNIVDDYLDGFTSASSASRTIENLSDDLEETDRHITEMVRLTADGIAMDISNGSSRSAIEKQRDELEDYLKR